MVMENRPVDPGSIQRSHRHIYIPRKAISYGTFLRTENERFFWAAKPNAQNSNDNLIMAGNFRTNSSVRELHLESSNNSSTTSFFPPTTVTSLHLAQTLRPTALLHDSALYL